MDERLEEDGLGGYVFYVHSIFPLHISIKETRSQIEITVSKFYKGHLIKNLCKTLNKTGVITEEQRRELVLDVIEIFLRK